MVNRDIFNSSSLKYIKISLDSGLFIEELGRIPVFKGAFPYNVKGVVWKIFPRTSPPTPINFLSNEFFMKRLSMNFEIGNFFLPLFHCFNIV